MRQDVHSSTYVVLRYFWALFCGHCVLDESLSQAWNSHILEVKVRIAIVASEMQNPKALMKQVL